MSVLDDFITSGLEMIKPSALPNPPRPMLAERMIDEWGDLKEGIRFPLYASYKLDGYRCIVYQGVAWTRAGKLHQCAAVQKMAEQVWKILVEKGWSENWALDGELMIPGQDFNKAGGLLRRFDYVGPFEYVVYDVAGTGVNFRTRLEIALWQGREWLKDSGWSVKFLRHWWIEDVDTLLKLEADALASGYEGLCTRAPYGMYKSGRGTMTDQCLLKMKRWHTAEAKVLGVSPRMENLEEGTTNAWGLTERGKKKDFLQETNVLGSLDVVGLNGKWKGSRFSIGTFLGLTDEDKKDYWREREDLIGQVVTYKFLPIGDGENTRPRHPVFLGFRPDWDWEEADEKK